MSDRRRYRLDGTLGRLTVPGEALVGLVILCGPCWEGRRAERKLGVFEMLTGPGADQAVWAVPFRVPGNGPQIGYSTAAPRVRGTGDAARMKLICGAKAGRGGKSGGGCRHTPDVPVAWITAQLAEAAAEGVGVVRKVPY